jgi:hypothetical protein
MKRAMEDRASGRRGALAWVGASSALAALIAIGVGGCGTSASDLCDVICACEGCNEEERDACISKGESAVTDADDKGCRDEYVNYLACVEAEAECTEADKFTFDGCDIEEDALATCGGGNACKAAATKLCDECNFSCSDPDPSQCNGQYECLSKCMLSATCEEIASQTPGSAYASCVQGC